jgi:Uncharacterized protein conserved in bacteria (DUF2252)
VDGRPFQVRQFRNRKGSVDLATLRVAELDEAAAAFAMAYADQTERQHADLVAAIRVGRIPAETG